MVSPTRYVRTKLEATWTDVLSPAGEEPRATVYRGAGDETVPDVPIPTEATRRQGLFKRRIAGAAFSLLLLLAGSAATYVWLRPPAVPTEPNLTGPTDESQPQMANIEKAPVRPDIAAGSLRQENGVVKPEGTPVQDALKASEWNGPVIFRGEIAHGLKIEMKLLREGSKLSGSYYYERIGKDILVTGTIEETGSLVLEEFVRGQKTGVFTGKVVSNERIEGAWSKPDGIRSRDFFLASKSPIRSTPVSHEQGGEGNR